MQLTQAQIAQFDRDGYLFFPSLFTPEEIQVLLDEANSAVRVRREMEQMCAVQTDMVLT
jgi:ectoine hydroxylase